MCAARRAWRWARSSWRRRGFVGGLVAQQFRDAQNGGQRIVQFVRHAGDHLAHGREALGLNELLLEPLLFGNVARGSDHAGDASRFVMQRPGGGAEHAPRAVLVLRAVFDLALGQPLENQIVEHLEHRGPVRRIRAASHPLPDQFLRAETENFENLGADKRVAALGIEGDDQVGEAVHQAAREFLFAVEAALHFALLGDIHETFPGSAQTCRRDRGWPRSCAPQPHRARPAGASDVISCARRNPRSFKLVLFFRAVFGLAVQGSDFAVEQVFLILKAEHLRQRRVDLGDAVVRGGEIDAFAQGLKQFGEARFAFAFLGHVARKAADSVDHVVAHDGVQDAIKIAKRSRLLHARANHAGPAPPLKEAREPLLQGQPVAGFGKLKEFVQPSGRPHRQRKGRAGRRSCG